MTKNRKNDTKYHEILKQAAGCSYEKGNLAPEGYKVIKSVDNKDTGFHAEVLAKGNDVIIAYRGTTLTSIKDIKNDYAMARKNIPEQATEAIKVYEGLIAEPGVNPPFFISPKILATIFV